jgi:hypothetical protein
MIAPPKFFAPTVPLRELPTAVTAGRRTATVRRAAGATP